MLLRLLARPRGLGALPSATSTPRHGPLRWLTSSSSIVPNVALESMAGRRVFVQPGASSSSNSPESGAISFAAGGPLASLAESSAVCTHGGSVVHATVASNRHKRDSGGGDRDDSSFLPLTVDYRSRSYAFGRIPATNNRRERHGNDEEVLVARMIDRAIRPLFPEGLQLNELHVTVTTHAADGTNDPTVAAVNAASLALMRSRAPWEGPVGCVRVACIDGQLVVSPTLQQMGTSTLDFVYAGTEARPVMIECVAKEVPEAVLQDALKVAGEAVAAIIHAQRESLALVPAIKSPHSTGTGAVARPPPYPAALDVLLGPSLPACEAMFRSCRGLGKPERSALEGAFRGHTKLQLESLIAAGAEVDSGGGTDSGAVGSSSVGSAGAGVSADAASSDGGSGGVLSWLGSVSNASVSSSSSNGGSSSSSSSSSSPASAYTASQKSQAIDALMSAAFRRVCLEGTRADGRLPTQVRTVTCSTDVLPEVHGSAFFCRGDTHVLCTTTLGPLQDARLTFALSGAGHAGMNTHTHTHSNTKTSSPGIADISKLAAPPTEEQTDTFFLHYDFPPYCTGETGSVTGVNRRMVGHGNLADRAVRPLMPPATSFPYTVRSYAECTSSNGSSSMAAVAGVSLALVDAGVPIRCHVAGVSIGLVTVPVGDISNTSTTNSSSTPATDSSTGVTEGLHYRLLTDLTGTEDHYGDMDFKIAGTRTGVTAMQLDVKLTGGVPRDCLSAALLAARSGRLEIINHLDSAAPIATAANATMQTVSSLKPSAPRAEVVVYDPERRRLLLGPGGEMMRYIESIYQCHVDTREEGRAYIFGHDAARVAEARDLVQDLVGMVTEGSEFLCEVLDIKDFGLMVKLNRAQEALLHMSELSHDLSLLRKPLHELVSVGQRLRCVVITVEKGSGLVRVSRKRLMDAAATKAGDALQDVAPSPSPSPASRAGTGAGAAAAAAGGDSGSSDGASIPGAAVGAGAGAGAGVASGAAVRPIGDLPSFPLVPPRKWSKEYFRHNISTSEDAAKSAGTSTNAYTNANTNSGGSGGGGYKRDGSSSSSSSSSGGGGNGDRTRNFREREGGNRDRDRDRDGVRGSRDSAKLFRDTYGVNKEGAGAGSRDGVQPVRREPRARDGGSSNNSSSGSRGGSNSSNRTGLGARGLDALLMPDNDLGDTASPTTAGYDGPRAARSRKPSSSSSSSSVKSATKPSSDGELLPAIVDLIDGPPSPQRESSSGADDGIANDKIQGEGSKRSRGPSSGKERAKKSTDSDPAAAKTTIVGTSFVASAASSSDASESNAAPPVSEVWTP